MKILELYKEAQDERVSVSCAALARILIGDKYLLFNEKKNFQPIGGALRYEDSAIPFLDSIGFQPERDNNDLRINIPRSKWETYKQWFNSNKDRELTIKREVLEELQPFMKSNLSSIGESIVDIKEVLTNKNRIFQIHELRLPENILKELLHLVETNEQFILATAEQINAQYGGISEHSKYIL